MEKFVQLFDRCKILNEDGGDWEKKNKLNVYEAILCLMRRDIKTSS